MNHDFDNEFETDDELKRGRSRRKDGRKYASSGLTGRTGSTGRGSRTARTAARSGKSRLRTIIIFIVAEIIALALIGAGWYGKRMMSLMQTDTEFNKSDMTNPYISVEKEQAMKGYWTVALLVWTAVTVLWAKEICPMLSSSAISIRKQGRSNWSAFP